MFRLFTNRQRPVASLWRCFMGWRVATYQERDDWISLQIEPMHNAPCRVYVPNAEVWQAQAPEWAKTQRALILQRLQQVAWNRDLAWTESPRAMFWHRHVHNPVDGSLESTPGGRQLEGMRLFHPDSPARFSRRAAKHAWCAAAEQMCLQVSGRVNIDQSEIIPGSVFQEIELQTLKRNPNVSLCFAEVV